MFILGGGKRLGRSQFLPCGKRIAVVVIHAEVLDHAPRGSCGNAIDLEINGCSCCANVIVMIIPHQCLDLVILPGGDHVDVGLPRTPLRTMSSAAKAPELVAFT